MTILPTDGDTCNLPARRRILDALDLLGRRTALRLLWELMDHSLTFRGLQQACESNSRLLNKRLVELKEAGLIEHGVGGYRLTAQGRRLGKALTLVATWAETWNDKSVAESEANS